MIIITIIVGNTISKPSKDRSSTDNGKNIHDGRHQNNNPSVAEGGILTLHTASPALVFIHADVGMSHRTPELQPKLNPKPRVSTPPWRPLLGFRGLGG